MKKTFFSLIMLLGCTLPAFAENTIPSSFPRKFLLEQFTGQTCPNCPNGILAINEFIHTSPENYIWIAHHVGFYADDYTISESNNIKNLLNPNGAPNVCINRNYQWVNGRKMRCFDPQTGLLNGALQLLDSTTSPLSVVIDHNYDPETRELNITVHGQVADTNITHINLSVAIKENALAGKQSDYYLAWDQLWTEYLHMATLRDFYCSKGIGDGITISNQQYSKTYTVEVDSAWVDNNCTLVAFATDTEGRNVYNAEEVPLVKGTTGGNDCIAYGITQHAEPNKTLVFPTILAQENVNNLLQIMMLSNQVMRPTNNRYRFGACQPLLLLNVVTTDKQLQPGTYPILGDSSQNSVIQGFRVDTSGAHGGSLLIYASAQYLQYQQVVGPIWRLQSGTVTVDKDGFMSVKATTYNGSEIECTCTASTLTALEQVKPEIENNTIYNILGQPFDQDPTQLPQGVYIQNGRKFIKQ